MVKTSTMNEALGRIRKHERDARAAAKRGDNEECYAALERCQHAAFDAKALFNGAELDPEESVSGYDLTTTG